LRTVKSPLLVAADKLRRAYWFVVRPRSVGVLGLVLDEERRILLVEQTYRDGWYLPGGGVRRKEGLDEALRRELREEVGIEPTEAPRLHGVYWNFAESKSDYVAVFVVERWERRPARSMEIARDAFYATGELPEDTSPAARRRIAELEAGGAPVVAAW
jgi:ADP-ribose pyrophosphatase YjhB (NUDIX family)